MNSNQELYSARAVLQRRMWYSIELGGWDDLVSGKITGEELLCEMILGSRDDLLDERIESGEVTQKMLDEWADQFKHKSDFLQRKRYDHHTGRDLAGDVRDKECVSRQGLGKVFI